MGFGSFLDRDKADSGFSPDHLAVAMSETKRLKLEAAGASLDGETYDQIRQVAWVQRAADVEEELWRPPKLHRVAAKSWLEKSDNQINQSTCHVGWKICQYIHEHPDWLDPYKCPGINTCIDYGGDMLCANNALLHKFDCNTMFVYDYSHLTKRKFEAVMKAVGLWAFCLLLLITLNLDYGPYTDETRKGQIVAVCKWFYTSRRHAQVPLFLALALASCEMCKPMAWRS